MFQPPQSSGDGGAGSVLRTLVRHQHRQALVGASVASDPSGSEDEEHALSMFRAIPPAPPSLLLKFFAWRDSRPSLALGRSPGNRLPAIAISGSPSSTAFLFVKDFRLAGFPTAPLVGCYTLPV
jgi:hypothetical protein